MARRTSQTSQMLGGRWSFGVVRREAAYDRPSAMRSASGMHDSRNCGATQTSCQAHSATNDASGER